MNAHIRLIALAVGLALSNVALADLNPGSNRIATNAAGTQVAATVAPTDAVDGSLQEMEDLRNSLLRQFSADVEQTLEQRIEQRRQFLAKADVYQKLFRELQENYRRFLGQKKVLEESCATDDEDIAGMPALFAELLDAKKQQCSEGIAEIDTRARAYAQQIDEASAFSDELEKSAACVRNQVDRLELAQKARDLRDQVDQKPSSWHSPNNNALVWPVAEVCVS
ncbi:MAG: hypothetical protein AB2796_19605 [Candidatus Thiodiazotropha sp.]